MKHLTIFLAFFVCLAASQDLEIPRDLLEPTAPIRIVTDQPAVSEGTIRVRRPPVTVESDFVPRCLQQPVRSSSRLMNSLSQCEVVTPYPDLEVVERFEPDPPVDFVTGPPEFDFRPTEVDVDRVCPIGQIRTDFGCVSQHECPEGLERRGGRCVRIFVECPTGFRREGSRCIQIVQCPRNYEVRGDKCVLLRPDCASGYYWNGQQCLISEIECPSGYVYINGQCVREIVTCSPDEINVNGECRTKEVECPPGYNRTATGFCERRTPRCEFGFTWDGSACSRRRETIFVQPTRRPLPPPSNLVRVTQPPPVRIQSSRCPEGYQFYQGSCYRCSDVPEVDRPVCQTQTKSECCNQGSHPAPNININVHNHGSTRGGGSGQGYNIVNNIHPANNTIHNINNVTAPITINNVNDNSIAIQHGGHCRDGTIKTTVIRNNVTEHSCTDVVQESGEEVVEPRPKKCCQVATPRKCHQTNGTWGCGHRRYKYCGDFCTSNRVFLRPQENTFDSGVLTFAPVQPNPQMMLQSPFGHGGGYMGESE